MVDFDCIVATTLTNSNINTNIITTNNTITTNSNTIDVSNEDKICSLSHNTLSDFNELLVGRVLSLAPSIWTDKNTINGDIQNDTQNNTINDTQNNSIINTQTGITCGANNSHDVTTICDVMRQWTTIFQQAKEKYT